MTKEGLKSIDQIQEGDIVLARDENGGINIWRKVVGVMTKMHDEILVLHFEADDGTESEIITTDEHPFYVQNLGWVEAGKLKVGQVLETANGFVRLTKGATVAKQMLAYDLTVDDAHTFFVGESQVWVHNCPKKMTREERWQQLAKEGKLSKQETEHIRRHGGKGMKDKFGKELAHKPKKSAAQGHGYEEAVPKTSADHRGIQHRFLKERKTGTTISKPKTPRRPGAKLNVPPPGALP